MFSTYFAIAATYTFFSFFFFFQAEDGIRDLYVTGVQTCALPISVPIDGSPWRRPHLDVTRPGRRLDTCGSFTRCEFIVLDEGDQRLPIYSLPAPPARPTPPARTDQTTNDARNRALDQRVASTRSSDARIEASRPGRSTVSAAALVVSIALTAERIATRSRSRSSIAARA